MATEEEVFDLFGRTAFKAQMFECSMKTLATTMRRFNGEPFKTKEEAQAYIETLDGKTLGRAIGQVRELTKTIGEDILEALSEALEARNRLMHDFFLHHSENGNCETSTGRDVMMEDLLAKKEQITRADALTIERVELLHDALREHGLMAPKKAG